MRIKKIHIKNFKSIEDLTLDFERIKGLWEINGPTGAGKTSVGEALLFGLFGSVKDKTNEDLLMWGQKKGGIDIELESNGHNIFIERTLTKSSSPLEVTVDSKPLAAPSKKDVQKILENEYYDISRLSLELLCIITFNGFKSLSNMTPSDTRKFLDQTFGLEEITTWAEESLKYSKNVQQDIRNIELESARTEAELKKVKEWRPIDEEGLNKDLEEVKKEYNEVHDKIKDLNSQMDEELKSVYDDQLSTQTKLNKITLMGQDYKKKIEFINKGICPTCGQPIDKGPLKEYEEQIKDLKEQYKELKDLSDKLSNSKKEIQGKYTPFIDEFNEKQRLLIEKGNTIKSELSKATKCDGEISVLEAKIEDIKRQALDLNNELQEWQELKNYLANDARQYVLNARIPYINQYANEYLLRLELPYTVKVDPSFKCSIRNTSLNKECKITSLSTGQSKMLDMVLILSILKVLLSKVNFNICFCDELLSNMDAETRDKMCMLLKENLQKRQTMFLLCHAPLSKENLDGTIDVELKKQKSVYSFSA